MSSSPKHGGQSVHLGSGPDPLSTEGLDEVVEHQPADYTAMTRCVIGRFQDPLRHQLIEILPITPEMTVHRLNRLICPCCSTST